MPTNVGLYYKTPIILCDGRKLTIEELSQEFNDGKENYVYSLNKNNEVVESKVIWCGKLENPEELERVMFYNTTEMWVASDNDIVMLDGKSRKCNKVKIADHIMPFTVKTKSNKQVPIDPKTYHIVKQIKHIKTDTVYGLKTENKCFALNTIHEDGSWCEHGGCFVGNASI